MNFPVQITIADRIKNYRKEHNLLLHGFGKLLGVSAQAVYMWENNVCYPDIVFLPHLAKICEMCDRSFLKNAWR